MESQIDSTSHVEDLITNCLELHCPRESCLSLVDPNPNGCCAGECGGCGQHYCVCCHARFADGEQCGRHVVAAHGGYFALARTIKEEQNKIRLELLLSFLKSGIFPCEATVEDLLAEAAPHLELLGLPLSKIDICNAGVQAMYELEVSRKVIGGLSDDKSQTPHDRSRRILRLCHRSKFAELAALKRGYDVTGQVFADIDWSTENADGNTAVRCAMRIPHPERTEAVQLLLNLGAGDCNSINECNPLHYLFDEKDYDTIQCLLDAHGEHGKLNVNVTNAKGRTPLFLAAMCNQLDIADALLRLGADVRTQDSAGHSVLVAVAMGVRDGLIEAAHLENSVVFWLDHDADIEHITRGNQWRPLHYAAAGRYGDKGVLLLLRKGANVHVRGDNGETPLMVAVREKQCGIEWLVEEEGAYNSVNANTIKEVLQVIRQDKEEEAARLMAYFLKDSETEERQVAITSDRRRSTNVFTMKTILQYLLCVCVCIISAVGIGMMTKHRQCWVVPSVSTDMKTLLQDFVTTDVDCNGQLFSDELSRWFVKRGNSKSESRVLSMALLDILDEDKNNMVDWTEFSKVSDKADLSSYDRFHETVHKLDIDLLMDDRSRKLQVFYREIVGDPSQATATIKKMIKRCTDCSDPGGKEQLCSMEVATVCADSIIRKLEKKHRQRQ